jgi:hypothetical protein
VEMRLSLLIYTVSHKVAHPNKLTDTGLNNYEWCGDSSYNSSGWANIVRGFSEIPTASYMSEYGYANCNIYQDHADSSDVSLPHQDYGLKWNLYTRLPSPTSSLVVLLSLTSPPATATVWSPSRPMETGKSASVRSRTLADW